MARTNGPLQVWSRGDTIPTDAQGGYAGGDSTAAAIGGAMAQVGQAARLALLTAAWDGAIVKQAAAPTDHDTLWVDDEDRALQYVEGGVGLVNEARQHATHSATAWLSPGGNNVRMSGGRVTATSIVGATFSFRVNDLAYGVPVTPGDSITYSALVGAAASVPETAKLRILWWTATGTVAGVTDSTNAAVPTGAGARWSVTGVAPANAAYANTQVLANAAATTATDWWVTQVAMTRDGSTTYIGGDMTGYVWTGTPGLSPVTGDGTGWMQVTSIADLLRKRGPIPDPGDDVELPDPLTVLDPGLAHTVRLDTMRRRRGGTIGVGDKQVISIRLDHGWMEARTNGVIDLLDSLDIPYHLAMCSAYNGGAVEAPVDWADVAEAARSLGAEVGNHSRTHASDAVGLDAQRREIVDGLTELQALVPEQAIEVWTQPSITGTQYDGYDMARTPDRLHGTTAGRMLLAHHGFVAGIGARWVALDGTPTQGMSATFTDNRTPAQVIGLVEQARTHTPGLGFVLALHPGYVGDSRFQTLAQVTEWLTWLAAERDAGRVELLTHAGMACATTRDTHRQALASWSGTINAGSSRPLGVHSGTLPVQGSAYYGGMWQAVADVTAPDGSDVTLTATCGPATAEKTVTVPAGGRRTIRRHVLLPADAPASPLVTLATTGALTVHDLRLHAV